MRSGLHTIQPFDQILSCGCAIFAIYSVGASISNIEASIFFAFALVAANLLGYAISKKVSERIRRLDGFIYAIAALLCVLFVGQLNEFVPNDGFPQRIIVLGILSWMLLFGSLFTWSDGTLCFQVVPCIALFGLVGAFDTFRLAPALFFLFLACAASLFFRAHSRAMVRQASAALHQPGKAPAPTDQVINTVFESGAWRWMAGPDWALGSSLVIILISLVAAPIIQASVMEVTGALPPIPIPSPTSTRPSRQIFNQSRDVTVGQGPVIPTNRVVLKIRMAHQEHLRGLAYNVYTGTGWTRYPISETPVGPRDRRLRHFLPNDLSRYERLPFEVQIVSGEHEHVYVPGIAERLSIPPKFYRIRYDGFLGFTRNSPTIRYSGVALNLASDQVTVAAASATDSTDHSTYRQLPPIPSRLRGLAAGVVQGASSDWEKVLRIKNLIEQRCKYNTNAKAIPSGVDSADYFLFESKEGYCDLFATSMAVMARAVGLPSRVVVGFYPLDTEGGYWIARDANYHMWAEVHFAGLGWVPFDPTEGAMATTNGGVGTVPRGAVSWYETAFARWALDGLLILCGLIVVIVGLQNLARGRRGPWHAQTRLSALYSTFVSSLERMSNRPKVLSQTSAEYVAKIETDLGPLADQAHKITDMFERALYSPEELKKDELDELAKRVAEFKKEKVRR